jgi:diaminopimelate epimerase
MKKMTFIKAEGSGNDFVLISGHNAPPLERRRAGTKSRHQRVGGQAQCHTSFVKDICDRKFGAGADGVLFVQPSKKADVRMRIFNADGSEAEMCGNGARCVALYFFKKTGRKDFSIETGAGLIGAQVTPEGKIRLKMTDPTDIRLDLHVNVRGKDYEVDYVNTGVPHAVIEVGDIGRMPVAQLGRAIRHHKVFSPAGTNVDFIHRVSSDNILIRTYERGVEDETLACGTGSVAAAIISVLNHEGCGTKPHTKHRVSVCTRSGEILTVYFAISKKKVFDVWLEGRARIVFEGKYFL